MFNLIRMEFLSLKKAKAVYIVLAVAIGLAILSAAFLYAALNPDARQFLISIGFAGDSFANTTPPSFLELFHIVVVNGGTFAFTLWIICAVLPCSDYDSGFIKNITALYTKRWKYIAAKLICLSFISLIYIMGCMLAMAALNLFFSSFFSWNKAFDTLSYIIFLWLLFTAMQAFVLLICTITRSMAISITLSILFGSGLVYSLLAQILSMFGLTHIANLSIAGQICNLPARFNLQSAVPALSAAIIGIILYGGASCIVLSRKDIQ